MGVKVKVALEIEDWNRARALMAAILGVVDDGWKGGDEVKIGFERKMELGRQTKTAKDDFVWTFGEPMPSLEELGFSQQTPIDQWLAGRFQPQPASAAPAGVPSHVTLTGEQLESLARTFGLDDE